MNSTINEIITRVLSGEASSEEMRHLLDWFRESDQNPKEFAHSEMLWNALEIIGRKKDFNSEQAYAKFVDDTKASNSKSKSFSFVGRFAKIAAVVVFSSGLSFFAGYLLKTHNKPTSTQCQIVTPKGSKAFVELADGSKVWLNAESKLKYAEHFNDKFRDVYLTGEAYFEVAKDKKRPFIVHTSKINVRAVGTAFNVKSYPSEDIIQTTLVEGSVVIEKHENTQDHSYNSIKQGRIIALLTLNQQATFFKSTSKIDIASKTSVIKTTDDVAEKASMKIVKKDSLLVDNKVNTELFTAWKDDRLLFDNETFESLSVKLERRFNMKFIFMDNEIKSFRFTGHFNEISIEQFLAALQYASPFHYAINKTNIYLNLKPIKINSLE